MGCRRATLASGCDAVVRSILALRRINHTNVIVCLNAINIELIALWITAISNAEYVAYADERRERYMTILAALLPDQAPTANAD